MAAASSTAPKRASVRETNRSEAKSGRRATIALLLFLLSVCVRGGTLDSIRLAGGWLASVAVVTYAARGEQTSPPCALKGPCARNASWRPMVFQRHSPRRPSCRSVRRERRETDAPRSFGRLAGRPDVPMTIRVCISLCAVAPVKGGGGPRVLGRAARLIEGPIPLLRRSSPHPSPRPPPPATHTWCVG